ncbi:MAG: thioredoxin [Anaerolineae bacterium]|nr:thioredoxin [Anaerolineae bacterium]
MSSLQYVDDSNFREVIDASAVPVLVDFYADWCPPCRRLTPLLEKLSGELDGQLKIVKLDVDSTSLASQFGVMNIPTMILFKNGQEVNRLIGNQSRARLMKELTPHIN